MPTCYNRITAYQVNYQTQLLFKRPTNGQAYKIITLSCGKCIGCRVNDTRDLATRMMNEVSMHEHNQFLTLTIDDSYMNSNQSLVKSDFCNFMKRLRKYYQSKFSIQGIRFTMCGEYGELTYRPHYHAVIYNLPIPDLEHYTTSKGNKLYTSKIIEQIWQMGNVLVGNVTEQTCQYVTGYLKKGQMNEEWETDELIVDRETGEFEPRLPPYRQSSNRPGIGHDWYQKYKSDCFPSDFIVLNGQKLTIPKYYSRLKKREDEVEYENILSKRKEKMCTPQHRENTSLKRLEVRKKVQLAKSKNYYRDKI